MSIRIVSTRGRFRPESVRDFSQRSRRLSRWLGLPHQRSQELLARIYGYSDFHELHKELDRPATPGPFDESDLTVPIAAKRDRELRVTRLVAEFKGVKEEQLSPHERAVAAMGLFLQSTAHRSAFNTLTRSVGTKPQSAKPRRVVFAPLPSHPSLPATFADVECADDEEVAWVWTETLAGRYVSGYRLVPRSEVEQMGGALA